MITYSDLEEKIKKGNIDRCYVFSGIDEQLMKESIQRLSKTMLDKTFMDLNYVQFDGSKVEFQEVVNACETVPFMSDKKLVVLYRANFLKNADEGEGKKKYDELVKYAENMPSFTTLVVYHVLENNRDKPAKVLGKTHKNICVVKFDKLKGSQLQKKVNDMFIRMGKEIGKSELVLFCQLIENNMEIMVNESRKLCDYVGDREIRKEDILLLAPPKNDEDVFNLVDFLAQKKIEQAIEVLNQLISKGEKAPGILRMIQRQYKMIFSIKIAMENGKQKDIIAKELRLHPFICEKMMEQSKKFSNRQVENIINLCLSTEKTLKSSALDSKTELELLFVKTIMCAK